MKTVERTLLAAACALVMAGCARKDQAPDTSGAGSSSGAEAGAAPVAAGPDGGVTEQQVDGGHPPSDQDARGSGTFSVKLKPNGDVPPDDGIVPGDYTMLLAAANVVSGSAGGLSVELESLDDKKRRQTLRVMLASSGTMNIGYTYEDGKTLHFTHPPLPFTLTDANYPADPHDARGHAFAIGPVVTRETMQPNGIPSRSFVHFKKFKLVVTDATVAADGKLTMSCTFSGTSVPDPYQPPAVYSISGSFKITGAPLGQTFKD
jgi:hypothetical protein